MQGYVLKMKDVVICPECGREEYYGQIHWRNGRQMCRYCIYERWKADTNYQWEPGKNDYVFPLYSDGEDYRKET